MIATDKLRPWQRDPAQHLFDLLRSGQNALDASDTGCHAAGTLVLMFDGALKRVEDIVVGDIVMGWDSTPRTVLSLSRGIEQMAEIRPVKGDSFVVNRSHILSLIQINVHGDKKRSLTNGKVFEVSVCDWLKWPKSVQHLHKLFRVPISCWPERQFAISPYYLGLLLGDGCLTKKTNISLSKPGPEMFRAAQELAYCFGCRVSTAGEVRNPSYLFRDNTSLWEELCRLGLAGTDSATKFVPAQYLTASYAQRSELLAGLIDTDGSLSSGGYDYISKSEALSAGVAFLARSLGLAAYLRPCNKYCQTGIGGTYYRVSISGDAALVPCRIPAKKAPIRKQIKSVLRTGFSVALLDEGEFFGFTLSGDGRFCLGDFTVTHNTGKTFSASWVAKSLGWPCLVTCPKIAVSQWKAAAAHFDDTLSIVGHEELRTGRTPFGTWANPFPPGKSDREYFVCLFCMCRYDPAAPLPCHAHARGIHCVKTKKRSHRYGHFTFHPAVKFLIVDEVHKFAGLDSLNADMLIAARRQRIPTLMLSATPGTSPLHFRAIGFTLGLHSLHDFPKWAAKFGVRRDPTFKALHWPVGVEKQREVMEALNREIFPTRGVRVRKEEIPGFPEVEVASELYDLEATGEIDAAYREMADELRALEARQKLDVDPSAAITIMLRAQQKIELIKVPLFADLAADYVEKGVSIGIFVNFHQTIDALAKRLKTSCIIDGRAKNRQANIDAFQRNDARLILVQTSCGGLSLSLQDLHGGHPRGGLVSAGFSATALQQLFGRFPRDGARSKSFYRVIFAAGTVEEQIHRAVRAKQNNLSALVDGDLIPRG